MRVPATLETGVSIKSSGFLEYFSTMLRRMHENIARAINGAINFGDGTSVDNIDGSWITVTTPASVNTDFTIVHNLRRIPVGYIIMSKSAATDVYTGSVAATQQNLTLRATVGNVALKVFVV